MDTTSPGNVYSVVILILVWLMLASMPSTAQRVAGSMEINSIRIDHSRSRMDCLSVVWSVPHVGCSLREGWIINLSGVSVVIDVVILALFLVGKDFFSTERLSTMFFVKDDLYSEIGIVHCLTRWAVGERPPIHCFRSQSSYVWGMFQSHYPWRLFAIFVLQCVQMRWRK